MKVFFQKILSFVVCSIFLSSCSGFLWVNSKNKKEKTSAQTSAQPSSTNSTYAPTAFSLASDRTLIANATSLTSPLTASGPFAVTNGIVAAAAPPALGGPLLAAITLNAPAPIVLTAGTALNLQPVSSPTLLDASQSFDATISTTATFPASVPTDQQLCTLDSPFASVTCAIGSFSIASTAFTSGVLSAIARAGNGSATDKIASSKTLPVKKFKIRQISNFYGTGDTNLGTWATSSRLYFLQLDGAFSQSKYFSTNGLDLVQITNTNPGSFDYMSIVTAAALNGAQYFPSGIGSLNTKLVKFDGTTLTQLSDISAGSTDTISNIYACGGYVYFKATVGGASTKLFSTDGTNIYQLSNIFGGSDSFIQGLCVNGTYILMGYNSSSKWRLMKSTGQNLIQIGQINGAGGNDIVSGYEVMNNRFYFVGYDTSGFERLFSTDGTDYVQHTNFFAGNEAHSTVNRYKFCNNTLYFFARINATDSKLFSFDGSVMKQISNINPAGSDGSGYITCLKDKVLFIAQESAGVSKLYQSDGTTFQKVLDIRPGVNDNITLKYQTNDFVTFYANDTTGAAQLYSYDGTKVYQLTNLASISCQLYSNTGIFEGRLFMFCKDSAGRLKLFSTDGTDYVKHLDLMGSGADDMSVVTDVTVLDSGYAVFFQKTTGGNTRLFSICADSTTGC